MFLKPDEINLVNSQLLSDEKIQYSTKQDILKFKINPTIFAITNKRVIIIKRLPFNIKSNVDMIGFKDIASVQIANGLVLSSVLLRVFGTSAKEDNGTPKEGIVEGLNKEDAKIATKMIDDIVINSKNFEAEISD